MPTGKYKIFTLLEDYGLRMLACGNASGGWFYSPYRSFLVDFKGSTEFVSIAVSPYFNNDGSTSKTVINVSVDTETGAHNSLEMICDKFLAVSGRKVTFYHSGKIIVGRYGCAKTSDLRSYVEKQYPSIIEGNMYNLGTLNNDRLWYLDDPEVTMSLKI